MRKVLLPLALALMLILWSSLVPSAVAETDKDSPANAEPTARNEATTADPGEPDKPGDDSDAEADSDDTDDPRARMARALALFREANTQFENAAFAEAAKLYQQVIDLAGRAPNSHFHLARCLVHLNRPDEALTHLEEAARQGYADPDTMQDDEHLKPLREREKFKQILAAMRQRLEAIRQARGGYSKPIELKGVRTLEGQPDKGFRWRLRISPEAAPDKPSRLIVWLHPSGGSMNEHVERLAPLLVRQGFALLVITEKNWAGWSGDDAKPLAATLEAIARTEGLDARKPLLMGYSAGGQFALTLWQANPDQFGALILDAAYPLDLEAYYQQGKAKLIDLPEHEALARVPFFVLVGERDGGSRLWKQAEEAWKQKVPLTVHYIPGQGHTWLFGRKQVEQLLEWLKTVPAPPAPADEEKPQEPSPAE